MQQLSGLESLFSDVPEYPVANGEYVLRIGDKPRETFLVTKGYIRSFSTNHLGDIYTHLIFRPGDVFPVTWDFIEERRDVAFQAIAPSTLKKLPRSLFMERLMKSPQHYRAFLAYFSSILATLGEKVENLHRKTATGRIAYHLIILADRFGEKQSDSIRIAAPISNHEIALSVNLSDKTVARVMKDLVTRRIVAINDRVITILSMQKLESVLKAG